MKSSKFKYYDYLLLWSIWITTIYLPTVCGMEQHNGNAITPFGAVAIAAAINPNTPTRIGNPGSSGQKAFKDYYSKVLFSACVHKSFYFR